MKSNLIEDSSQKGNNTRKIVLVISLVVLLVGCGITLAYLTGVTEAIKNIFTSPQILINIEEEFDGNVKSNVRISIGHREDDDQFLLSPTAYVRAKLVVFWEDANGSVYPVLPVEGVDYTIEGEENYTNWDRETSDGYYYYKFPVADGEATDYLFDTLRLVEGVQPPEEGFNLTVDVIAEGIKADPTSVVQDAWGVTVVDGTISKD